MTAPYWNNGNVQQGVFRDEKTNGAMSTPMVRRMQTSMLQESCQLCGGSQTQIVMIHPDYLAIAAKAAGRYIPTHGYLIRRTK